MSRTGYSGLLIAGLVSMTVLAMVRPPSEPAAAEGPQFTQDGQLILPTGYRKWMFVGAPLTPNGLNNGKAGFPEYHNVYIDEKNFSAYQRTGVFPEGTVMVKELVLLLKGHHPDGSEDTPSGRGFNQGQFNGMDVSVKDSKRFASSNNWGFFNFGHHALPYERTSKAEPKTGCAACHLAGAGKTDMVWLQYYPILRAKN